MKCCKHKFLLLLISLHLLAVNQTFAQFNNEWIDYNKTYFKFKVGQSGLYRIPYTTLQANGLGATPAEQFQLWRNGVQVPIFTSVSSGVLSATDFLEFYGQMNDGKADAPLYKQAAFQLSDRWSLQTDTAAYFLTVNATTPNARLVQVVNNTAGNTLTPEPYFMHALSRDFKDQINGGYASVLSVYVYSSSYDNGEGWSSRNIQPATPLVEQYNNLSVFPGGPAASLNITAFGNAQNIRNFQVSVNGSVLVNEPMNNLTSAIKNVMLPANLLGRPVDTIRVTDASSVGTDRITLGKYVLTYPRTFNFGGASMFEFKLPASTTGNYLEITNFNNAGSVPVLFEFREGKRYLGDISVAGKIRFALPAGSDREFVLLSAAPASIQTVSALGKRNFINFLNPAQQGSYLIIAHNSLRTSSKGDAIENYRTYRNSANGGSHKAYVYDIDELVDQFAFGIKKHPSSVKNFIAYARTRFAIAPSYVLLMGKAITYDQYRLFENRPSTERINLVPTFGNPGSDNILASDNLDPTPEISIGRLSVTNGDEINTYLDKIREHDNSLLSPSQSIASKAWMKNIAHVVGGGDPYLQGVIARYMTTAENMVEDTSYGARVFTFEKLTSAGTEAVNSNLLSTLFNEGLGMITYFGHSSASSMEFNLDDPAIFNNPGKYPLFLANGCNAGNFFTYDTLRATAAKRSISENYILTAGKGSIGFIASTHYGLVNYLNLYTYNYYKRLAAATHLETVGQLQSAVLTDMIVQAGLSDYYNVLTAEQMLLDGDPAVRLMAQEKPDHAIEESMLRISPAQLSVTNSNFEVRLKVQNIGRATRDSVRVHIRRELPDGSTVDLLDEKRFPLFHSDSVSISVPINPILEKGQNRILVDVDPDDLIDELSETNNSLSRTFMIVEDEVRPIYPSPFGIVGSSNIRLTASATTFLDQPTQFVIEVDTTELFDSPMKVTQTQQSKGGVIDFNPVLQLRDSLVFYWRVAKRPDTGSYKWAGSSFVYLANNGSGWSESHYYQFLQNVYKNVFITDRQLKYAKTNSILRVKTSIYPNINTIVSKDLTQLRTTGCGTNFGSLEFLIFDKVTGNVIKNVGSGTLGSYNSYYLASCYPQTTFQHSFSYNNINTRRYAADFFDLLPAGKVIVMTNWSNGSGANQYINAWKQDTTINGSGKSLYHKLKGLGFDKIDSFYRNIPLVMIAEKDFSGNWKVVEQQVGAVANEILTATYTYDYYSNNGSLTTPLVGPAKTWKKAKWQLSANELPNNDVLVGEVYGIDQNFHEQFLFSTSSQILDTTINQISASAFPYLRIAHRYRDTASNTPPLIRYLQVDYDPVPEGAITNLIKEAQRDTIDQGEVIRFKMSFKNISEVPFDSVRAILRVTDPANNSKLVLDVKLKPLVAGDTIAFDFPYVTQGLSGANDLFFSFNPEYTQPEQFLFNNFLMRSVYVRPDDSPPNMDVTFDGMHILNRDIVSSKPDILIRLKDDSKYLALNDTSLFSIRLRLPDGRLKSIRFDNDTLQLIPANLAQGNENVASVHYRPKLDEDGTYELIVNARDRSNIAAGKVDYNVSFDVINKPMITNMLNYPNPFTTSTAFVFTLTGSELPTHFRIQIMTVTGKIVKEITRQELGPIHIGNNITEYKWDGRDQFGQALANGVYLYRVIAELGGVRMEKLNSKNYNTDKYFNSGYGKMYLMR